MGNTAQSWLRPDEQILYWARQSAREALQIALLTGLIAAVVRIAFDIHWGDQSLTAIVVGGAFAGLGIGLPHFVMAFRRLELVLTSDRLFYRKGLVIRKSGEVAVTDIREIKGSKSGDQPFELKTIDGESLQVAGLPDLGQLRETLAKAAGTA